MRKVAFISLLFTAGCTSQYVNQAPGPSAELLIQRSLAFNFSAQTYLNAADCSDRKLLVKPTESSKQVSIPAYQSFSYTLSIDTGTGVGVSPTGGSQITFYGCNPTATFVPEAGAIYVTEVNVVNGGCVMSLKKKSGTGYISVPSKERIWKRGFSEGSSFCS